MKKKNIVLAGLSTLAVLSLASCATNAVKMGSVEFHDDTNTYTSAPAAPTYSSELKDKNLDIYINYEGESGVTFRGTSWNNSVDGYTYTQGSVLPTWTRLGEITGTNVREACGYMSSSDDNAYTSVSTAGYKSETDSSEMIDLFYNSTDNLKKAGNAGNLIDLSEHLDEMPNLKKYLEDNPAIKEAITVNGHIYYAPYKDGNNDVENTFIMDTEMVTKLLDGTSSGDDTMNGTGAAKNTLQAAEYQAFIKKDAYSEITVGAKSGTGTVVIPVSTTEENIIEQQNKLLASGCTGDQLLTQLKTYIKNKYNSYYSTPSELYVGYQAGYNVDELIALMRVVKANPGLLTGNKDAEIQVYIPRGETSEAIESVYDLAQLWGVQGVDSENGNYYFAADGTLNTLETSQASYDALKYISQLYDEGLILDNFYVASATKTSTRYLEQYYKKTMTDDSYAFMMYDDATIVAAANDEYEGIGTTSRYGENAGTQGIRSVLPPLTYWTTTGNNSQKAITDLTGKTLTRYYESNRSLQTTSWGIPSTSDNVDAALRMIDVMYSELGSLVQNYGPEEYWAKDASGNNVVASDTDGYNAIISKETKVELVSSQDDFWSFMRGYVGATHGIGYIRKSGLNEQATNYYGQTGLKNVSAAISNGLVMHATDSKTYSWNVSVPVSFSTSVTDNNGDWDGLTGFWAVDKINKNEGWVNVVIQPADTDSSKYVIKTAKNAKAITYDNMIAEESAMNTKCLYVLAKSLGDSVIPDYAKTK